MGINRVEPFEALADIYQTAGFSAYSAALAESILSLAFDHSWTGKMLLDLGCGAGDLATWFGGKQIRALGIDHSPAMVQAADANAIALGVDATFAQGDIRAYAPTAACDLVTCVGGTLNSMTSLRDIEAIFRVARAALAPRKLFFFDLRTIQSLAGAAPTRILASEPDFMVISQNSFNYETLALTTQYTILRDSDQGWTRAEETHTLRGYPAQSIAKLLQNVGLRLLQTITPNAAPLDAQSPTDMLLFVAQRDSQP